jgi:hypothetical protein
MKFKQLLQLLSDLDGFFPTPQLQWVIRKNPRNTAREEAIAAEVLKQANPRENISGSYPWGPEEKLVLQQLWVNSNFDGTEVIEWRDVPIKGAEQLYSMTSTEFGDIPIPNAIKEPGQIKGDFQQRLNELLGGEEE